MMDFPGKYLGDMATLATSTPPAENRFAPKESDVAKDRFDNLRPKAELTILPPATVRPSTPASAA
ncbi:malto-oligosyltrehalose trehalohydrolase [Anopheles sinensis]|uniref:Malto-oligosyltrehalose trehalohydrolase n=1 Tax=Anopheles sinensis TaxID=74873 RepID=A0A084VZ30_ANOSI|nr:malto-oligosyltrehalose trehalohydrolase [Anopheles sinensis]